MLNSERNARFTGTFVLVASLVVGFIGWGIAAVNSSGWSTPIRVVVLAVVPVLVIAVSFALGAFARSKERQTQGRQLARWGAELGSWAQANGFHYRPSSPAVDHATLAMVLAPLDDAVAYDDVRGRWNGREFHVFRVEGKRNVTAYDGTTAVEYFDQRILVLNVGCPLLPLLLWNECIPAAPLMTPDEVEITFSKICASWRVHSWAYREAGRWFAADGSRRLLALGENAWRMRVVGDRIIAHGDVVCDVKNLTAQLDIMESLIPGLAAAAPRVGAI